jgi:hypothetical protein
MDGNGGEGRHDLDRVVDRQGRLRREGKVVRIGHVERCGLRHVLDQQHGAGGKLAHGADHLGMAGMADQHDGAPGLVVPLGFAMDLGDQRAGGVDKDEVAACGLCRHRFRHAVRREHHRTVVRHLVELLDEDRPLGLEARDDGAVVHDLVADIDRPAVALDGALDDLDGTIDAGAEAARAGEQDRERRLVGLYHEKSFSAGADPFACRLADHCLDSARKRIGAAP